MQNQQKAYLYMVAVVFSWATVATAFKIALGYVDPQNLLFYSSLVAICVLFLALVLQKKLTSLLTFTARDLLYTALLGFLNPFIFYVVLFIGYDLLPAQVAMVINFTWPITLTILSVPFLGQKIGVMNLLAILISFLGVVVISTGGNFTTFGNLNPAGIILIVFSTVVWSLFWILNVRDKHEELGKLFFSFIFGFIYIAITLPFVTEIIIPDFKTALSLAYVGIFEMGLTFVLWLKALNLSRTTAQVSNLIFLIPFISLVIIHLVLKENIYLSSLAGLILIVAGILIQQRYSRSPE